MGYEMRILEKQDTLNLLSLKMRNSVNIDEQGWAIWKGKTRNLREIHIYKAQWMPKKKSFADLDGCKFCNFIYILCLLFCSKTRYKIYKKLCLIFLQSFIFYGIIVTSHNILCVRRLFKHNMHFIHFCVCLSKTAIIWQKKEKL